MARQPASFGLPIAGAIAFYRLVQLGRFGSPFETAMDLAPDNSEPAGTAGHRGCSPSCRSGQRQAGAIAASGPNRSIPILLGEPYECPMALVSPALVTFHCGPASGMSRFRCCGSPPSWWRCLCSSTTGGVSSNYGFRYSLDFTPFLFSSCRLCTAGIGWPEKLLYWPASSVFSISYGGSRGDWVSIPRPPLSIPQLPTQTMAAACWSARRKTPAPPSVLWCALKPVGAPGLAETAPIPGLDGLASIASARQPSQPSPQHHPRIRRTFVTGVVDEPAADAAKNERHDESRRCALSDVADPESLASIADCWTTTVPPIASCQPPCAHRIATRITPIRCRQSHQQSDEAQDGVAPRELAAVCVRTTTQTEQRHSIV